MSDANTKFEPYVKRARETLEILTTPKEGYDATTSDMNVVELFNCQGVVFLSSTKAGLVISGMHGTGFVMQRITDEGVGYGGPRMSRWSAPVPISMTSAAIGLTAGYGHTDSIIVLDTEKAVNAFKHTQVSLGNDFTIRAGAKKQVPLGGDGGGHIDLAKFRDLNSTWDSFAYTVAQGAIIDMSFSGDGVSVGTKLMKELYGEDKTVDDILDGKVEPPECMGELYTDLESVMAKYYEAYQEKKRRQAGGEGAEGSAAAAAGEEGETKEEEGGDADAPADAEPAEEAEAKAEEGAAAEGAADEAKADEPAPATDPEPEPASEPATTQAAEVPAPEPAP